MAIRLARSLPFLIAGALLAGVISAQAAPALDQAASTPATPMPAGARAHPMVEKRIADLRAKLKITPDEGKPFDDFAQVMRDNANRMGDLVKDRTQGMATMTALDHMKAYEAMSQAHADNMQRLVPAFSRLYDAMTPEQKKLADQSFRDFGTGRRERM